jgi:hypothetical protein
MGQEFADTVYRVILDSEQHILQPGLGIDLVHFTARHEGIHYGDSLGRFVITGKEVIFSAQGYGSDGVFDQVIIDFNFAIQEESFEFFPAVEAVSDGLADGAFGQYLLVFCFEIFM